ncbi:MAG: peptidoglycan DD-metalloendopeptidase family protein [Haliea sp.]|jgi:septal ring factor EnvC (AmiA/AmiB activator)|nr:peptidoglycan DD-metalloendopeptidase family protein [Haliea sp.]
MPLRPRIWRRGLALILLASLSLAASGQSDEEKARSDLQQLQRDIQQIQRDISSATTRKNKLQRQLRDAEVELGELQRAMAGNRSTISASEQELGSLEKQREALELARDQQQARIAIELKTAWQMGRQGQIKVLLNQESPHTVARAMGYYRYFFEARNELLGQFRETLEQLQVVEQEIESTLARLGQQQRALEKQQQQLVKARETRTLAVAKLNGSIRDKGQQLKQKEQDRRELEKLLKAIEEAVVNLEVPENYQAFNSARGKMPWPVNGKPSNRFGRPRNEGKMRWQGVNIPAAEGTTVKAIHHGRVVYADWLRGSGLLLIIDHGDGYMSLYAHNQSLLRDVGEWVSAGTPISTVGDSGGLDRAALYFEIRHQGKPTDPARWCRG